MDNVYPRVEEASSGSRMIDVALTDLISCAFHSFHPRNLTFLADYFARYVPHSQDFKLHRLSRANLLTNKRAIQTVHRATTLMLSGPQFHCDKPNG